MTCFLSQFSDKPCSGRLDPAHLISKQRIKRDVNSVNITTVVWDSRVIVPACRSHHAAFDIARTLRVPREALPAGVEAYARQYGLEWALDREFGPLPGEMVA